LKVHSRFFTPETPCNTGQVSEVANPSAHLQESNPEREEVPKASTSKPKQRKSVAKTLVSLFALSFLPDPLSSLAHAPESETRIHYF